MMTDPLADMLTRIRNAVRVEKPAVEFPASNLKAKLAGVLKSEGYIIDYQIGKYQKDEQGHSNFVTEGVPVSDAKSVLRVYLKYGLDGEKVIRHIERVSKPGCRKYVGYRDLKPVLDGLGIAVLSTSHGLMSDRQAKVQKVGGEVICNVW